MWHLAVLALVALVHPLVFSLPTSGSTSNTPAVACVVHSDFPDPAILQVDNKWYSYATTGQGKNVQVAVSQDFLNWSVLDQDAMPTMPSWVASNPQVWAPDVIRRPDGKFVLYFSAAPSDHSEKHCVGAATSTDPTGPYLASDQPFTCPIDQGGAIDASGFHDGDQTYVVYKIDGNSLDGDGQTHSTPIMLQEVSQDDGITHIGDAIQVLDRSDADGPLVEAPSLARHSDGTYFLFFSSNVFSSTLYDISYATAQNVKGPYTKATRPFMVTGDVNGITGPGGASVAEDMSRVVFHAFLNGNNMAQGRAMWVGGLDVQGEVASLAMASS